MIHHANAGFCYEFSTSRTLPQAPHAVRRADRNGGDCTRVFFGLRRIERAMTFHPLRYSAADNVHRRLALKTCHLPPLMGLVTRLVCQLYNTSQSRDHLLSWQQREYYERGLGQRASGGPRLRRSGI